MQLSNTALQKAETSLPFFDHDNQRKRNYLSFRICGYGRLEARQNTITSLTMYRKWLAEDSNFAQIEQKGLLELSRQFRNEVVGLEFTRNFKLCLDKDRAVLQKSVRGHKLTEEEWDYLKKIRPLYTPAALKALEDLITGAKGSGGGGLESWDELIVMARRNSEHQNIGNEITELKLPTTGWVKELEEGSDSTED